MRKWIFLTLISVVAFASVFVPAWLIQPFKPQTSEIVKYAFLLRRWSPEVTLFFSAIAILLLTLMWQRLARWWQKVGATILVIVCLFSAWFARQNHFEWMFRPLPNASYTSATNADFVADSDMVLAVKINGEEVAYPVLFLAYHHLVHDVVGAKPLIATY